jgi:tetratricopeptide (TPR) repeat protein
MARRLFINNIPSLNRLVALEFGRVDDGHPPEHFDRLAENVWLFRDPETRKPVGFTLTSFASLDLNDTDSVVVWSGPRFDAPTLGLTDATIGEIGTVAKAVHGDEPTLNRIYFRRAASLEGQDAIDAWRMCLECGDCMAHFGLGCALYENGQFREAYQHLRHYAHLAPVVAWNWRWYGVAAAAIGENEEARRAYEEAIRLNEQYCQEETDAADLLTQLGSA